VKAIGFLEVFQIIRWHMTSAEQIHPELRRQIWAAVQNRSLRKSARRTGACDLRHTFALFCAETA
jgi:hypothetical protein